MNDKNRNPGGESNGECCATTGCFKTAYGTDYCGKCLDGKTPMKRGPVTNKELMRARAIGGEDKAVTRARLIQHGQPTKGLD